MQVYIYMLHIVNLINLVWNARCLFDCGFTLNVQRCTMNIAIHRFRFFYTDHGVVLVNCFTHTYKALWKWFIHIFQFATFLALLLEICRLSNDRLSLFCYGLTYCSSFWLSRQASIVLERYFRFEISLLSILCVLIARMEMGTSRVSGDSDIIT